MKKIKLLFLGLSLFLMGCTYNIYVPKPECPECPECPEQYKGWKVEPTWQNLPLNYDSIIIEKEFLKAPIRK